MHEHTLMTGLGLVTVGAPALLLAVIGLPALVGRPLGEVAIGRGVQIAVIVGLLASIAMLGLMLALGTRHVPIELGDWAAIPNYHFAIKLVFDRLSVPFVILTFLLCGTVGAFTTRYLHREPGFSRFFVLYALFILGMILASLADTIETLFIGWELVGLSSAFLVAFFQERPMPVRNGLRVWAVYRLSDAALLLASVVLHHQQGHGDFDLLLGAEPWPFGEVSLTSSQSFAAGSLLLIAAAGKSALVPFSGWLPRAMEGPTPSSAVFYGALSVHLGAFLLLRFSPLLVASPLLAALVVGLGLATAVFAAVAARVQTDVKSALSFASLTQVGIIVAEIGLGFRYLALVHILGHACLRMLQFLRAPTLLHDYHVLDNALGGERNDGPGWTSWSPGRAETWWYRFVTERGYLDALLADYLAAPLLRVFRWCDAAERRWTDFLAGGESRPESDHLRHVMPWDETP
jgi:NADH:ubiquinone oxidoreductase subunit 5 (subunit L)/multisubunit Na+/H+ antiporter MnhA subunit